jgi:hypothetical protein
MRLLIGAALAAFVLAAPAAAQNTAPPVLVTQCGDLPSAPELPDGARANERAMIQGRERFEAWLAEANRIVACRSAEMGRWKAEYDAHQARAQGDDTAAASIVTNWAAEIEEYNARQNRGSRNRAGGDPNASPPQTE